MLCVTPSNHSSANHFSSLFALQSITLFGQQIARKMKSADFQRLTKIMIFRVFSANNLVCFKKCPFLGLKITNYLDNI
jgi:hypothetical protein